MNHPLREPCRYGCGCTEGFIETKNGQDCVYCFNCRKHQYNAPKTETGRAVRTVKTTHSAISPGQRYRIIERAARHCELCHCEKDIHVGHIVSVDVGLKMGMTDREINADENLMALCDECNLGMKEKPLPVRILVQLLRARYRLNPPGEGAA